LDEMLTDTDFFDVEISGARPQEGARLLAHSYTPWQFYKKAYSPATALMKGTLFPELYGVYRIPK
jgi:hypothetical protein